MPSNTSAVVYSQRETKTQAYDRLKLANIIILPPSGVVEFTAAFASTRKLLTVR